MTTIKTFIPGRMRRILSRVRTVVTRVVIWQQVRRRIAGRGASDRAVLRQALRRAPLTVFENWDQWQFPMTDRDCMVVSKGVGVFRIRARTDDLFHVLPQQEPAVERTIRKALRPGDVFVDAGSNIGFYSILSAQLVGKQGRVIACEMMPETADILRMHISLNGSCNVTVVEGALSSTDGHVYEASYPPGKFGQASIVRGNQGGCVMVRSTTLESVLHSIDHVRMMKMDLEGAELDALRGLGTSVNKIHMMILENRNAPEVVSWLERHGFVTSRIDGNNMLAIRAASRNGDEMDSFLKLLKQMN
jgi:FkbM family methyltransferase